MPESAAASLRRLDRLKDSFGAGAATEKLALLKTLERRRLKTAAGVLRLHECLCFLRAYPDNRAVLARVERLLDGFARRRDLRAHSQELLDSGIAGTSIYYAFYWATARWLVDRWPDRIFVDWEVVGEAEKLEKTMDVLLPYSESPALDNVSLTPREWIERLKGPKESDAAFLVRRYDAVDAGARVRQTLYEDADPFLRLDPGPGGPSRTGAKYARSPVVFQKRALDRSRPSLSEDIVRPPRSVRPVSAAEGQKLIDLAREAMITRSRDLDAFMYADKNDVRMVNFGDGLQFACMGTVPERRLMLEAVYGFLTLKNGVPMGYVLASGLMQSSEVAYNVFETYRGGESARIFGKVVSMIHHLFDSDAFTLDPYQLGYGNQEGLESGAWWFYYKLGFRPYDPAVRRVLRRELARMKKNPRHRSNPATLETLASKHVFWFVGDERRDVLGRFDLGKVGLAISDYLARRFGGERERGLGVCASEARELLGVGSVRFRAAEKLAWERWSPLVLALPGVKRWSETDRKALAAVVRAKGGRRESEFVRLFDAHPRLRAALVELARK